MLPGREHKNAENAGSWRWNAAVCRMFTKRLRFAGKRWTAPAPVWFHAARVMAKTKKVTCESCYFRRNTLCALALDEPCSTYRPDSPEGLRPPPQMRFLFRQERRTQATWAFPTAQEQAALYG
jgi:hypothetical protein